MPGTPPEARGTAVTVVGVGASAGGLHALKMLLGTVPRDSGLAFVIVVHLPPDHESHLADLLQPHSTIPVAQVTDGVSLDANHAYVIPPGMNVSAVDTHLHLTPLEHERRERAPIDRFLQTLANTYDGSSVGVILTGTGSDGSHGVQFMRECGGLSIVQHPGEAEYDSMPRRAIETGQVDLVLPVESIVAAIIEFARTKPRELESEAGLSANVDAKVDTVLTLIKLRTGHDFSRYKRSSTARRLARRMQIVGTDSVDAYTNMLRARPDEALALVNDLLINVTSFFRDAEVFQELQEQIIPRLFDGKGRDERVRVWSVGCASGEEAYSIAMLLDEEAGRRGNGNGFQVFASDLHEGSLAIAREGVYGAVTTDQVSPERVERYFRPEGDGYRVVKSLRDKIVFARHNLLSDPPFSRLDLILCRNVLIYLGREVQREAIDIFHYALVPEGFLVLGTAETVEHADRFRQAARPHHIYQRRQSDVSFRRLPQLAPTSTAMELAPRIVHAETTYGALHHQLVERFAAPSVLVSRDGDVLHISENAGRYLLQPGGQPTANLNRLIRKELRMELRTLLLTSPEDGSARSSHTVSISLDGVPRYVVLRAHATEAEADGVVLITFDEFEPPELPVTGKRSSRAKASVALEEELGRARSRMHELVDQYEGTQQNMRAANEELQSSNEELRSTMEELETSREELQSLNEELQTLNQENKHKVEELSQLSSDLHNLLQATGIATIFLDRSLRIVRFTPTVRSIFNVRSNDRGRPLSDLTHKLGYPNVIEDASRVLATLVPVEVEVETTDRVWHLVRITPYRTTDDHIDGIVITMVDVTSLKRIEAELRESEMRFEIMANAAPLIVWVHDAAGHLLFVNNQFLLFHGVQSEEVTGDAWEGLLHHDDRKAFLAAYAAALAERRAFSAVARQRRADGEWRWMEISAAPRLDGMGTFLGFTGSDVDVTERRRLASAANLLGAIDSDFRTFFTPEAVRDATAARVAQHFHPARVHIIDLYAAADSDTLEETAANDAGVALIEPWIERLRQDELVLHEGSSNNGNGARDGVTAVPMLDGDALVAVLLLERPSALSFDPESARLLRDVCTFFIARYQRMRAEHALRLRDAQYRMMVAEAVDYAIFTLDRDGRVVSWSPGAEAIFRFTPSAILGTSFEVLFVPEDIAAGVPARELATAIADDVASDVRWHQRKVGPPVFIEGTTRALRDVDGEVTGFLKVGQDVTVRRRLDDALRESEARYRTLVDNVHDHAIFLVDQEGIVSEWTQGAERLLGHSVAGAVGLPLSMIFPDEAAGRGGSATLKEARELGRAESNDWCVRRDGVRFWASTILTAIPGSDGGVLGYTAVVRDLTQKKLLDEASERVRLERERNELRRRLAAGEEAERRRLSREIHDEAGQHLTVLGLGLKALADIAIPDSDVDQRVGRLQEIADRLGRDLHALAVRLRPKALDDFGLQAAIKVFAESWATQTGIATDVHVDIGSSRLSTELESAVYRIVQEALTNSARHSGASRVSIMVERRELELRVIVEDNGVGFDASAQPDADRRSEKMGLPGIEERATLLGGTATVESSPGNGVTIIVRLPLEALEPALVQ